jgi:hypothetical protein
MINKCQHHATLIHYHYVPPHDGSPRPIFEILWCKRCGGYFRHVNNKNPLDGSPAEWVLPERLVAL